MKVWLVAASAMVLAVSALAPVARAEAPQPTSQTNWPGVNPNTAAPSVPGSAPHYVWQEGYEKSGQWRGRWVLVR